MPAPLQIIPENAFDTSLPPPQYSADFASIVGNAASDTDGFETIFSTLAGHLADAPNFLVGLDSIVDGLGGASDPAGIPFEQDFSDSLASTISAGQGDFDTFAVHLTGNNPPAQGGGGVATPPTGGDIGPTGPCDECIEFSPAAAGGTPVDYPLSFQNQTNGPVRVTAVTIQQGSPAVFGVKANLPAVIDVAGNYNFSVTVTPLQSNTFHALLTILSTQGTGKAVACIKVPVAPAGTAVPSPTAQLCGGTGTGGGGSKIKPE